MAKTYTKRIRNEFSAAINGWVSLYVNRSTGRDLNYFLVVDRVRHNGFQNQDAAMVAFNRFIEKGLPFQKTIDIEGACSEIEAGRLVEPVRLDCIMELYARHIKRLGRSPSHVASISSATRVRSMEAIPPKDEWAGWCDRVLQEMTERIHGRAALVRYTSLMLSAIKHFTSLTCATKYAGLFSLMTPRVARVRKVGVVDMPTTESRECLTLRQMAAGFDLCQTWEQAALALAYLSGGFRAKEAERVSLSCVNHRGRLDMSKVATKVKVNRYPRPTITLMALLRMGVKLDTPLPVNPDDRRKRTLFLDRRHYRPTCATMLVLSGVSLIEVAERLNHASVDMAIHHYAKMAPADILPGQTLEQYLNARPLIIAGQRVEENTWDRWVLIQALQQAQRFGVLEEFKAHVVACLGGQEEAEMVALEF
jgi:integrase